ncbi:Peptidase T [Gemmata obscuriglobus]|uniref:Peptidase T n=1 Tax=Gemmata obscuriglobus TaxID=114 RepID=A0A2Z3HCQ6_9BACT|nr:peptidase T [Gemmata obscuriglobus]AWM41506.1 peptidase T [Gemmata obscuriglobus]QEG32586.1 Peptidase T [Gemmata obscuriglobus]VTS11942.1 peptidase t : Peptidase T OS=Pirellula staleyi (strain ATCC 27377 / DSM 6068 / ICPB 4128) GN=Psta_1386 PE=4 SV=1: Peptidase_M20: M20_dimer [Gemmata obscuriglobus UQM 2246]
MALATHTLLDRFLRYVRIDTKADERSTSYPSSPGQLVLGAMLRDELLALGLKDAVQDEHGLVFATVPGNVAGAPTIAFNAHVDTNPENSGKDVQPQVIRDYRGGDIVLPKDTSKVIRVAENPELNGLIGKTIITTDGTTLLGADDKAGVAVIMEAARLLTENPQIPHGPVRIVFTCDEEIGFGVKHLEPAQIGAAVAYTLDGAGSGEIEDETFSADAATVTITGVNIHPSIAKGRMVNAVRLAAMFVDRLPQRTMSPETTDGRQGFLHPITIEGGAGEVKIGFILRDFDTAQLAVQADLLREIARQVEREHPAAKVTVETRKQYRNMKDGIARLPAAVTRAAEAVRRAGMEPKHKIIRGGTDGSQLTEKGLPTPNLSTGEHNPHSPLEWTCLEEMEAAVRVVLELCQVWAEK